MDESIQERQSNELAVLKAIFVEQCKDCNEETTAWQPLNVILTILPQKGSNMEPEVYVQVDLHVIASDEYPEKEPKILLENGKGLSDKQLNEMQTKLEELAKKLKGEVMVFEFAQYVQSVLTDRNKPGFESFYEEMLSRQQEKEQKEVELKQTEEDIKRQLIDLEVKELKKERKRQKKQVNFNNIKTTDGIPKNSEKNPTPLKNVIKNPQKESSPVAKINHKNQANEFDADFGCAAFAPLSSYSSRISRDFEILDFIGKGAYGNVLKARNKLDDCLYAIKRIHLNSKNRHLNRKIMREVKLLSRLNHENVVRYYNSWLEECTVENADTTAESKPVAKNINRNTDKRELPPQKENLSFSFSRPNLDPSFSDNDDDDDDEDDCEWISFIRTSSSNLSKSDEVDGGKSMAYQKQIPKEEINFSIVNQFLYIQMEYCEKSTLRNAIDNNLYLDEQRVWRLLREIVEGLAYIHQQGIIHRDLKPVNIFIDSEDHVKIGDFGLATPNKHMVVVKGELDVNGNADAGCIENSERDIISDASHTGQVGTALYVSPELSSNNLTVMYNQKVDIYSLGVIFFEMCYRPLHTEMERIKVLTNLRHYSRNLPSDFLKPEYSRQIKLIRDLLNHNPKERPTAEEILQNKEYIPAADLGDVKFIDTIRHTLLNPQSKTYKHLISECFNQKVSAAEDIIFDSMPYNKSVWYYSLIEKVLRIVRQVFQLHGGTYLNTPLLMPDSKNLDMPSEGTVSLMTKYGALVNMPYDLRIPFARYLAQNPLIMHLKRYNIDKVFREHRMFGIHPKEVFESSFDIVSSLPYNLSVEAELLSIAYEIFQKSPMANSKNYLIRVNHTSLFTAILLHCGIKVEKHSYICNWINKNKVNRSYEKNNTTHCIQMENCDISKNILSKIMSIIEVELPLNGFLEHFDDLIKNQSAIASNCKHAFNQLQTLISLLEYVNIQCPVVIAPDLITNIRHYSGIMFQIVWNKTDGKNRHERHIIATGGRYDPLIAKYRKTLNINKETTQTAAGISIYIDRLLTIFQTNSNLVSTIDVLVCSVGESDMINEKLKIVKRLWSAGIKSTVLNSKQCLEETQDYCKEMNISHIIFVKEAEIGIAGVRSLSKDRFYEKKMPVTEIVDYLHKIMKSDYNTLNNSNSTSSSTSGSSVMSGTNVGSSNPGPYPGSPLHYSRSDSQSDYRNSNVIFLTEDKFSNKEKRRYENQILNAISNNMKKFSSKSKIEVLALNVEGDIIKQLAANIDINNNKNDFASLIKQFPRYKKDLKRINHYLDELQLKDNLLPVLIFYSLSDSTFKILV